MSYLSEMWRRRPGRRLGMELLVSYLGLSGGILIASGTAVPESVKQTLPPFVHTLWGGTLILGCASIFYAVIRSRLLIEKFGLIIVGPSAIVYALTAFSYFGWAALFAAVPYVLFTYGCFDRISEINEALRSVKS